MAFQKPIRITDGVLALSDKKQAAYATILADEVLQAGKRFPLKAPIYGQQDRKFGTDRGYAFGATGYSSERWETERDVADTLQMMGDPYLIAWALAFCMGKVTSTQPNLALNPTAWQHVIKPLDPSADGLDVPVTTIFVGLGEAANLARRIKSLAISSVAIGFAPGDMIDVAAQFTGSGEIVSGALAQAPALSRILRLMANDAKLEYGPQGALVDISSEIIGGSLKWSVSNKPDEEHARVPGGGMYRSRAWVDQFDFTLEFQRLVDSTSSAPLDDHLDETVIEAYKITVPGPQIGVGPEKHSLVIEGKACKAEAVKLQTSGNKVIYEYSITPDHHFKEGANDVCTATVINTQESYLTAPAA
jgi:hypothetical protein